MLDLGIVTFISGTCSFGIAVFPHEPKFPKFAALAAGIGVSLWIITPIASGYSASQMPHRPSMQTSFDKEVTLNNR